MFNTKYPIVAVGMNQVSDINLAIAVSLAGGISTISCFNYSTSLNILNLFRLEKDLILFQSTLNNCDLILSIDDYNLLKNLKIINLIEKYKIPYLEIIFSLNFFNANFHNINSVIEKIKNLNVKIIIKTAIFPTKINNKWKNYIKNNFDAIMFKGSLGAGRVYNGASSLIDLTKETLNLYKNLTVIPSGGISSAEEVKDLLNLGAGAIGVGTLFAASEESPLSLEAKKQLVNSSFSDVSKLNTNDLHQNALIFSMVEQSQQNNTKGLIKGIQTGIEGHIFAGKGIDSITSIKPVKEIIEELCSLI
jgi:NAD(P)H-dependent flavin oxidoreductase YrpB (nitropropane dioxygenase family)